MIPPDKAPPWWQWPHLLALDAPVVAVVWQRFLAREFEANLPVAASVALGLVTWGVYLLDRRLDARLDRPADSADRHQFARRHTTAFTIGAAITLASGLAVALMLPVVYLRAGTIVGLVTGTYLIVVHLATAGAFKELTVGALFAAGVAVPLAVSASAQSWLLATAGFACLCWLNCRLIDRWERNARLSQACLAVAAGAIGLGIGSPPAVSGAILAAVAGLLLLDFFRVRFHSPSTACVG